MVVLLLFTASDALQKIIRHYVQYNLVPCREQLTVNRQTDRVNCRGAWLLKIKETKIKIQNNNVYLPLMGQEQVMSEQKQ